MARAIGAVLLACAHLGCGGDAEESDNGETGPNGGGSDTFDDGFRCEEDPMFPSRCTDGRTIIEIDRTVACEYLVDPDEMVLLPGGPLDGITPPEECETHGDCGPRGYCQASGFVDPNDPDVCSPAVGYARLCQSLCETDADCPQGSFCECGPTTSSCRELHPEFGCTSSADCGDGLLCLSPGAYNNVYLCEHPDDECASPTDCESGEICGFADGTNQRICIEDVYVSDPCIFD